MSNNSPSIQLPFTTSHAFIIGIDDYQHVSPLHTAVNDAEAIAQRLQEQHGFTVHPPLLNATHADMKQLLREQIPQVVGKDDRVLFYFAGHGIALDSEEGPNGYIVAADTQPGQEETLVAMNTLHDALTSLPCRHGLLILDCCFSGAFKWSSGFRDVVFDLPKVIYEERFWRYCKDPAWQVITSAAHDQKAVDIITNQSLGLREEGSGEHSPFARSLLRALDGEGDVIPAGAGDGVMTATELYSYLRDSVETQTTENAKRQSPSIFNLQRHDKGEFIFLHPRHRFNLPPTPDRNPFMGLASYNEDDANLFFGRDRVVETLLEKIKTNALTVVSGASGTGKSSVIKAGVLPQLRKEGRIILPIIRPGKEPMQTIATELPNIEQELTQGAPVLLIDQYEELITQCLHPEERIEFEQQIAQWLEQYPELDIILSIRSDFEPQFESEALAKWWQPGRYVVPSFSLDEVREVITRPAAQAVLFYEPDDMVERISEEVSQAPGALPLLSFTLSELYQAYLKSGRQDRSLAEEDYQKLGGVIGALRTRADAEYDSLEPIEQASMRKLMLRMVSMEGGELAGKRVYSEELHFTDAAETERMRTIADQLVDARLLLKGKDGQGRTYVEPAHDALVRAWARLYEWIKAVGEDVIGLQAKLGLAVNDYNTLLASDPKKARNLLWNNNPRLSELHAELGKKDHWLNAKEENFVRASIQRRKVLSRRNWSIATAVIIGLAALGFFGYSQMQARAASDLDAQLKKITNDAQRLSSQDPVKALRLVELGYNTSKNNGLPTQQLEEMLISLVHNGTKFQLHSSGNHTEDHLTELNRTENHQLEVAGDSIMEYVGGRLILTYKTRQQKDDDEAEGPYPSEFTKAYYSPNGAYVIAEEEIPEDDSYGGTPNYYIFSRKGYLLLKRHSTDERCEICYFSFPFFFDNEGHIYEYSSDKSITKYSIGFDTKWNGFQWVYIHVLRQEGEPLSLGDIDFGGDIHPTAFSISPSGEYIAIGVGSRMVLGFRLDDGIESSYMKEFEISASSHGEVTELGFFGNETILGINKESFYPLEQTLTFTGGTDYSHPYEPELNPINQELVPFGGETDSTNYIAEIRGLLNANNKVLIASDDSFQARHMVYTHFSDDVRYFYWNHTIYPIDPDLILSLINDYSALGQLVEVDLSEYTSKLPAPKPPN